MSDVANSGSSGAGQMFPGDGNSDYHVLIFTIRRLLATLDTMKLVQVKAVHGGGPTSPAGTVDVQPLVSQIDGDGNATPHGTVNGIPWYRPGGGRNAFICDPVVGDIGYVVCADRDVSNVKAAVSGGKSLPATPGSRRKHNVADGVYCGLALSKEAPQQYVVLTEDTIKVVDKTGNVIELKAGGIFLTPKTGTPVTIDGNAIVTGNLQLGGLLQSQEGVTYEGAIRTAGDIVAGAGTGGSVGLKTHVHTQPNDTHGDGEQPTNAPTGGT